jgi:hypothetical protein
VEQSGDSQAHEGGPEARTDATNWPVTFRKGNYILDSLGIEKG